MSFLAKQHRGRQNVKAGDCPRIASTSHLFATLGTFAHLLPDPKVDGEGATSRRKRAHYFSIPALKGIRVFVRGAVPRVDWGTRLSAGSGGQPVSHNTSGLPFLLLRGRVT